MNIEHNFTPGILKVFILSFSCLLVLMILPGMGGNATLLAQVSKDRPAISPQQRAMEAYDQMREYRYRQAFEKRDEFGLSSARKQVGIRINSAAKSSSTIFYYDDMESGISGWTTELYGDSIDNLWHQTTIGSSSPTHSWWAGIDIQANYSTGNRINTAAITPSIDLTGAVGSLTLLFTESIYTEKGWDYCMVDVTTDGGSNWTPLRGVYGTAPSGDSEGWRVTTLDLSAYAGSTVNIRFYFDTGDTLFNEFPGWFVDDVMIFDQGAIIQGKKFFDVNDNGVKDLHERGVPDWRITADGPISLTTPTNYRGKYVLTLPLGDYTVSEEVKAGWTQTYPLSGTWFISLTTVDTVFSGVHFGNYRQASFINGVKYHDLNRNGVMDGGDTVLPEWKITLADTNNTRIRVDRTDSLGRYSLYVFEPGDYIVREAAKEYWVQTAPANDTFNVQIPNLSTVIEDRDFGNYYSDSALSIFGRKFNDENRNGIGESHEPGVPDFKITLTGYPKNREQYTDDSGYYRFTGIPSGTYIVAEVNKVGWWQSYPESTHTVNLPPTGYVDSVDFGNYQLAPGSIAGTKWNDLNGNGTKDLGEPGLAGWKINLGGTATASVTTDLDGNYEFTGLFPGHYTVSESWRNGWRQTYPASLGTHVIDLGPEENVNGYNFGNTADSLFSTAFRSFTAESLALGKNQRGRSRPIKLKPDKIEFALTFVNAETVSVSQLFVKFTNPILDSLHIDRPGIVLMDYRHKIIDITLNTPMAVGESLRVWGFGQKARHQSVRKWYWTRSDLIRGTVWGYAYFDLNVHRFPMPNSINLLQEVSNMLMIGLGGPHTVLAPHYRALLKSLIERGDRMHIGPPRCLDRYEGLTQRPINRQKRYLQPRRHNNRLLPEAIALKVNIRGSDNMNLPPGFGDLIYDEGTGPLMPLNGYALREISALLDKYMSNYPDSVFMPSCEMIPEWPGLSPDTLYDRIRNINGAFSGPIDTISFAASGLVYTPVRPVDSVWFLRYDTSSAMHPRIQPEKIVAYVPEEFELMQNYPNPFNPTSLIEFFLPEESYVSLTIYNTLGQEIARVIDNELMEDGYQEITIDASRYPSGVYFYRMTARMTESDEDSYTPTTHSALKKMIVLK